MAISPTRITEIRDLLASEHRTHDQVEAIVEELLANSETVETNPQDDQIARIRELTRAVEKVATILRSVVGRIEAATGPAAVTTPFPPRYAEMLAAVAHDLDKIANRH